MIPQYIMIYNLSYGKIGMLYLIYQILLDKFIYQILYRYEKTMAQVNFIDFIN